jgi:2-phospho-L-lactate guanylyltransferase
VTTLAILPIKSFDEAKQRLRDELDPTPRRALVEAMFSDVLIALRRAKLVDQVLVVSADNVAQRIAGGYDAMVVQDEDAGHNQAAAQGAARALELGVDRVLMVPGDCPLISPMELDGLLGHPAPAPSVLIVPDRHGSGTNALALSPPSAIVPAFGEGSGARHVALARAAGVPFGVEELGSLGLDLDTPADVIALTRELEACPGRARRTAKALGI